MELTSGDAAERDALTVILQGQLQTGTIAGSQCFLILVSDLALDDGSYRMQDKAAREIEGRRDLCWG